MIPCISSKDPSNKPVLALKGTFTGGFHVQSSMGPFYLHGLILIPAWISMLNKMRDEIMNLFPLDKYFHPTLDAGCHYLFIRGLKLNLVSKRDPRETLLYYNSIATFYVVRESKKINGWAPEERLLYV